MQRKYLGIGSLVMLLSVALGAFGAHTLEPIIGESAIQTYETGVHYQMIHGIAIILAAIASGMVNKDSRKWLWACRLFLTGIILFSGSLYLLATTGLGMFGPITPLGGVAMIAGWVFFGLAVWKQKE